MREQSTFQIFFNFGIAILVSGIGIGALYSSDLSTEYKIIVFLFFFILSLIYFENQRNRILSQELYGRLNLIFFQLNLMGRKKSIKPSAASEEYDKEIKIAKEKEDFKTLLAGDWEWFTIALYLFLVFGIAALTVQELS
mgnify:FL=1|tara:strand:+ start:46 stop:462 length:417 start_codon:yes stop_codon:yes gene_type:complete